MSRRPLKILYLAYANYTGTLDQFAAEHRCRGHEAAFVTLVRSAEGFDNGICLDLWPNGRHKPLLALRNLVMRNMTVRGEQAELPGTPPFYNPGRLHSLLLRLQDRVYQRRILSLIERHGLLDYDVYHLEGGIDFFKDYRTLEGLKENGKRLIANYHGNDFRNRGVHPLVHQLADANTTSEWDVYFRYPGCLYLHLPLRLQADAPASPGSDRVVITHLVRSRNMYYYKGTEEIIRCVRRAIQGRNADFEVVCGLSHEEALRKLDASHILIDQIGGKAGWGYGMSAVEALSRGVVVCVEIQKEIEGVLAGHPFVNVNTQTLTDRLVDLLENPPKRAALAQAGREWVLRTHSIQGVVDRLYGIYREKLGILV